VQEFFNEVDMREYHPPAAVALQLQLIKSVSGSLSGLLQLELAVTHPSLISLANNSRYAFHLSPMTFPHEKHLTGIICEYQVSSFVELRTMGALAMVVCEIRRKMEYGNAYVIYTKHVLTEPRYRVLPLNTK
jgi:hypothetical protein